VLLHSWHNSIKLLLECYDYIIIESPGHELFISSGASDSIKPEGVSDGPSTCSASFVQVCTVIILSLPIRQYRACCIDGKGHALVKKTTKVAERFLVAGLIQLSANKLMNIALALGQMADKVFPKKGRTSSTMTPNSIHGKSLIAGSLDYACLELMDM